MPNGTDLGLGLESLGEDINFFDQVNKSLDLLQPINAFLYEQGPKLAQEGVHQTAYAQAVTQLLVSFLANLTVMPDETAQIEMDMKILMSIDGILKEIRNKQKEVKP